MIDETTLTQKLNEIAWEEQMNFWISEKYPETTEENRENIKRVERMLTNLGHQVTSTMLDKLEQQDEIEWSLRLSAYVDTDDSVARAKKYINHKRSVIRALANMLLQ